MSTPARRRTTAAAAIRSPAHRRSAATAAIDRQARPTSACRPDRIPVIGIFRSSPRRDPRARAPTAAQVKGRAAEARVDRAARSRGWKPVVRNYNVRGGELDLVYREGDALIVVEVRYRARSDYGTAVASVTRTKQRRIILATQHLLVEKPKLAACAIRFDVVGVDDSETLDWIENAFYAE